MNTAKSSRQKIRERRDRRIRRVRARVFGTPERPRLVVSRTHRHLHAQAIDDTTGRTLAAASTQQKEVRSKIKHGGDIAAAVQLAERLAGLAKAAGITRLAFDKRWYKYHGRIRAFADALRKSGLNF